jgi:hypothetical protein
VSSVLEVPYSLRNPGSAPASVAPLHYFANIAANLTYVLFIGDLLFTKMRETSEKRGKNGG